MSTSAHLPRQGAVQLHHFDNATDAQLAAVAPAIFAEQRSEARTKETYQQVRTIDLINAMRTEGWVVTAAGQKFTRTPGGKDLDANRYPYARHFVRMRRADADTSAEFVPEAIILNAHDGSAAFRFYTGAFRFVCGNGLIFGENIQKVVLHHSMRQAGAAGQLALEASAALRKEMPDQLALVETLRGIVLTDAQQRDFAERALRVRWPQGDSKNRNIPITTDDVLFATLEADKAPDAWTVFNRVQYHLVTQGGIAGKSATGRVSTSRPVTRVDKMVAVNVGLWAAILEVAGLRTPADKAPVEAPAAQGGPAPVIDAVIVAEAPAPAAPVEAAPAKAPKAKKAKGKAK